MATEIIVRPAPPALVAVTAHDAETVNGLVLARDYLAKITTARPRSLQQNKFYWGVLGKIVHNHSFYRRGEALHLWLKTRLGYVDEIHYHDGRVYNRVRSTGFEHMASDEFKIYLDAAIDVLVTEVLPGIVRGKLIQEVEELLGIRYNELWHG